MRLFAFSESEQAWCRVQIEAVYDPLEATADSLLLDRSGNQLPPFLVMEKGESLIDWSKRNRSDVFQAVAVRPRSLPSLFCQVCSLCIDAHRFAMLQVLAHVAMRLKDLHNAGFVHRDIKPGNIMLLHRKNRWTLIDFGCVAPIGEPAGLSFTLHYAAPEAVETWHRGEKKIVAQGALDAWALGVVAFELLTRKPAFQMLVQGKEAVRAPCWACCVVSMYACVHSWGSFGDSAHRREIPHAFRWWSVYWGSESCRGRARISRGWSASWARCVSRCWRCCTATLRSA